MFISLDKYLLNESNKNYIKLYRGDSEYIKDFNPDYFDVKNLFGLGLYLTDNIAVAINYSTTKKQYEREYEIFTRSNKLSDAENYFIINILYNDVNNTNYTEKELYEIYKNHHSYKEDKKLLQKYYDTDDILVMLYNDKYLNSLTDEKKSELRLDNIERFENMLKTYEKNILFVEKHLPYIEKARLHFNKIKKDWIFINKSVGNENSFSIIHKDDYTGNISEFEVSLNTVNSCYDANSNMNDDILKLLQDVVKKHKSSLKYKTYLKEIENEKPFLLKTFKSKFDFKNMLSEIRFGNNENEYSLSYFLYNNSEIRNKEYGFDKNTWTYFMNSFKSLGYTGIMYNGWYFLKSPIKHKSYVIFDMENVKRIK